jgi:hypothetical protein
MCLGNTFECNSPEFCWYPNYRPLTLVVNSVATVSIRKLIVDEGVKDHQ